VVDFGDEAVVCLNDLQPLWPMFRNNSVFVAKASLAGTDSSTSVSKAVLTICFQKNILNKLEDAKFHQALIVMRLLTTIS
jgi:hypothetical protein